MKFELRNLKVVDIFIGLAITLIAGTVGGLFGSFCGFLGGAAGPVAAVAHRRYVIALQSRAQSSNSSTLHVEVNGVSVGTIRDADYAMIRLHVLGDWRTHVAQAQNVGRAIVKVFDTLLTGLPLLFFWATLAVTIYSPETLSATFQTLRDASPERLAAAGRSGFHLLALASAIHVFLNVMLGARYGLVNVSSERTADAVRRRVGASAVGSVSVFSMQSVDVAVCQFSESL